MTLALSSTLAPRFLPTRLPKVCLALSGDTAEDMLATAESMARDNPFIEFRLDYLKQPMGALPKIHRFLETHQYVTAIGTCRRADNGGKFKGSLASQLEVLRKANAAGCQIVDLELQSALQAKPEAVARGAEIMERQNEPGTAAQARNRFRFRFQCALQFQVDDLTARGIGLAEHFQL